MFFLLQLSLAGVGNWGGREHLLDNMRIDAEKLQTLDINALQEIKYNYPLPMIKLLYETLSEGL